MSGGPREIARPQSFQADESDDDDDGDGDGDDDDDDGGGYGGVADDEELMDFMRMAGATAWL